MDRMYIGSELFWISFINGRFAVRCELNEDENETVFIGTYKECYEYMQKMKMHYEDSLF